MDHKGPVYCRNESKRLKIMKKKQGRISLWTIKESPFRNYIIRANCDKNADYGVNIITSSDFRDGTKGCHTWMDPSQIITNKFKLLFTYQVSAWVRLGSSGCGPQNVSVAIRVDDQWVNGGQVEINDGTWNEICGSFRIEKQVNKVMVYIQCPSPFYRNRLWI
uniref:Carbohydrate-binding, CenC-like protein n=1 Tax=Tanacetum cinerariifolium TaxID=118510 RepID=A0A699H5Z1_TANCI|nr:carbohydrate-binding, CenC-like protein [Tanacetum cinerariifolium]